MVITETETETVAKAKVCPNTLGKVQAEALTCIGSACMAWRWEPLTAAVKRAMHEMGLSHEEAVVEVTTHRAKYGPPVAPFRGWCGLAGEPRA
jgi:hypothetical protein